MRLERNPRFEREIQQTPEFRAAERFTTDAVAQHIRLAAEPYRGTGYFIDHIEPRGRRVWFRDVFSHLSEFGSANNVPQRNALRGVRAAGLRFEDLNAKKAGPAE